MSLSKSLQESFQKANDWIQNAKACVITAGAGIGVDSGLSDFRGKEGFWKAYPPIQRLGLSFPEVSTPEWFYQDPSFAWGFFGHRYHLYKDTEPHQGFQRLLQICHSMPEGFFVLTSNVDGHFQKAGFPPDRVNEIHGSIHYWQCTKTCPDIWEAHSDVFVDESTFRAKEPLPKCPKCGALARPNVLMFGDDGWLSERQEKQVVSLILIVLESQIGSRVRSVHSEIEAESNSCRRDRNRFEDIAMH